MCIYTCNDILSLTDCRAVCCVECKDKVPLPCVPAVHTPKKRQKVSQYSTCTLYM